MLRARLQRPQDGRHDPLPVQVDPVLPGRVPELPRGENHPHMQITNFFSFPVLYIIIITFFFLSRFFPLL